MNFLSKHPLSLAVESFLYTFVVVAAQNIGGSLHQIQPSNCFLSTHSPLIHQLQLETSPTLPMYTNPYNSCWQLHPLPQTPKRKKEKPKRGEKERRKP